MDAPGSYDTELAVASIPPFFDSPVSGLLIVVFASGLWALTPLHAHRQWMRDSTLMAWVAIVIIAGPIGALRWFAWGRPAVRRYGVSGEKGLVTGNDYP
ncbi:hypothetical protein [Microcella alkaliphila]|jgi:hypothetical protein|uniref:Nitrite reductase small subunit n=1 Tax=Microcella alkaliphila TaxID=279828 RepID=A0A0U5BQ45_9MICO|nr:hypothetical protein [Microcella alkaliphila]BAU32406.1 nitrite reductase small subunit [Microcella alkaliphila]